MIPDPRLRYALAAVAQRSEVISIDMLSPISVIRIANVRSMRASPTSKMSGNMVLWDSVRQPSIPIIGDGVTRGPMKSFADISDELKRLEAFDLKPGDWVWLKAFDVWPRQKARLRGNLAAVMLVEVTRLPRWNSAQVICSGLAPLHTTCIEAICMRPCSARQNLRRVSRCIWERN